MKADEDKVKMKPAVFCYCRKCEDDVKRGTIAPEVIEMELVDILHCPHTNILQRIFNPSWRDAYHEKNEEVVK